MANQTLNLTAGKRIFVESWAGYKWSYLKPLETWENEFFGQNVNFRIPSGNFQKIAYACKVIVTGRSYQLKNGEMMIKGKIVWYQDEDQNDEDNTSVCWLSVYNE